MLYGQHGGMALLGVETLHGGMHSSQEQTDCYTTWSALHTVTDAAVLIVTFRALFECCAMR